MWRRPQSGAVQEVRSDHLEVVEVVEEVDHQAEVVAGAEQAGFLRATYIS